MVSNICLITRKLKDNKSDIQSLFVVRDFEEENVKEIRKGSLPCCKNNFCLVTSIIASNQ